MRCETLCGKLSEPACTLNWPAGWRYELRNGIHSARGWRLEIFQDACQFAGTTRAIDACKRSRTVGRHRNTGSSPSRARQAGPAGSQVRPPHGRAGGRGNHDRTDCSTCRSGRARPTWRALMARSPAWMLCEAAFVNLSLNAIEAAGRHGDVAVEVVRERRVLRCG